ncbi:MAG TPA: hypothetical protein VE986_04950, partial [Hyphomicrobiales bacterium]|nr:hypothetical protein [Hyphomicrobiales bacterium]
MAAKKTSLVDVYHGTGANFDEFMAGREHYFSDRKSVAEWYANASKRDNPYASPRVISAKLDTRGFHEYDAGGKTWHEIRGEIERAKRAGAKGLIVHNVVDVGDSAQKQYVTWTSGTLRDANTGRLIFGVPGKGPSKAELIAYARKAGADHISENMTATRIKKELRSFLLQEADVINAANARMGMKTSVTAQELAERGGLNPRSLGFAAPGTAP